MSGVTCKYSFWKTCQTRVSTQIILNKRVIFKVSVCTFRSIVLASSSPAGSERSYTACNQILSPNKCPCLSSQISIDITIAASSTIKTFDLCKINSALVPPMSLAHPVHLILKLHVQHHNLQIGSHPTPKIG